MTLVHEEKGLARRVTILAQRADALLWEPRDLANPTRPAQLAIASVPPLLVARCARRVEVRFHVADRDGGVDGGWPAAPVRITVGPVIQNQCSGAIWIVLVEFGEPDAIDPEADGLRTPVEAVFMVIRVGEERQRM